MKKHISIPSKISLPHIHLLTALFLMTLTLQAKADFVPTIPDQPPIPQGIIVESIDTFTIPDFLKNQAKHGIAQMKKDGYVDALEETVTYLDRVKENKNGLLKPMDQIKPTLKITPANLQGTLLEKSQLLGAMAGGIKTAEGWTAVERVFVAPGLGLIKIEEIDYIASGGGLLMIKEAINQEVNGRPAILQVKRSLSKKSITELTWTTNQKIYTLSLNKAVNNSKTIDTLLTIARNIQDY